MSSRIILILTCVALSIPYLGANAYSAEESSVIVVPSRYTMVKLAFDMAKMRNVELVSYHDMTRVKETHLYLWDTSIREWRSVTVDGYNSQEILKQRPERIIVVGSDKQLPQVLKETLQNPATLRVPTMDIVTIFNTLNKAFKFTPNEWKWLAGRYGLKLKDLNEEKRRWGKYGKPGEETVRPQKNYRENVLLPREKKVQAEVISEEVNVPVKVETTLDIDVEDIAPEDK